jgi:hypothetical protein
MTRPKRSLAQFRREHSDTKENRPYRLSDFVFFGVKHLTLKAELGSNVGTFLEQRLKRMIESELSPAEIEEVKQEAEEETARRLERRLKKAGLWEEYEQLLAEENQPAN